MRSMHVVPNGDKREHMLTEECWCNPDIDSDEAGACDIYIHHAADMRELGEILTDTGEPGSWSIVTNDPEIADLMDQLD